MRTITLSNSLHRDPTKSGTVVGFYLQEWGYSFVVTAVLGAICGLIGLTLSAISLFEISSSYHSIDNVGAGFLILACLIPSLALNSLDKANRSKENEDPAGGHDAPFKGSRRAA